jgi:DNA-binding transcriptional LysR family regulator
MITDQDVRDGHLVELLTDVGLPTGEVYVVYTSRRFQAMKVRAFLDFQCSRCLLLAVTL